eukprot:UN00714
MIRNSKRYECHPRQIFSPRPAKSKSFNLNVHTGNNNNVN